MLTRRITVLSTIHVSGWTYFFFGGGNSRTFQGPFISSFKTFKSCILIYRTFQVLEMILFQGFSRTYKEVLATLVFGRYSLPVTLRTGGELMRVDGCIPRWYNRPKTSGLARVLVARAGAIKCSPARLPRFFWRGRGAWSKEVMRKQVGNQKKIVSIRYFWLVRQTVSYSLCVR